MEEKTEFWKEREFGTELGLAPQADLARAPPGHQAVLETLVTCMDKSSDLVPSKDCVPLCPRQPVRKRQGGRTRAEGGRWMGRGSPGRCPASEGLRWGSVQTISYSSPEVTFPAVPRSDSGPGGWRMEVHLRRERREAGAGRRDEEMMLVKRKNRRCERVGWQERQRERRASETSKEAPQRVKLRIPTGAGDSMSGHVPKGPKAGARTDTCSPRSRQHRAQGPKGGSHPGACQQRDGWTAGARDAQRNLVGL